MVSKIDGLDMELSRGRLSVALAGDVDDEETGELVEAIVNIARLRAKCFPAMGPAEVMALLRRIQGVLE